MKDLKRLLVKQLRRNSINADELSPELIKLLRVVSKSYDHFERDRKLRERAMELSSEELRANYEELAVQTALKRRNEELQQFVSIASHDLRSPLRTIASFSQMLKISLGQNLEPNSAEALEYIMKGASRMNKLIENLSSYAKLGIQSDKKEQINLQEIVNAVLDGLLYQIKENNVTINVFGDMPTLEVYQSQMIQLFQNLIGNAIKFRNKEVDSVINVEVEKKENRYTIQISDNGIGIDPESIDTIFDPFLRSGNAYGIEGTGLGLSICKKIMVQQGGDISVSSELGKGTTFLISFPVTAEVGVESI